MDEQERKELFRNTFNTVADGYDHSAMRFFPDSAEQISSYLNLKGDEHVLDVATGTGEAALTIARNLLDGHVTGIDFSEGMLSRAISKKELKSINNVTFVEMDMQALDFPNNTFDAAVSSFSIFFVEDMEKQLTHIVKKVKAGGSVIMTTFFEMSFSPFVGLLLTRLERYGLEVPTLAWKRVATTAQCSALFKAAGLQSVRSEQRECGYFLETASDWWYIVWNGGFRGLVSQLSATDLVRFKKEHLAEIEELATDKGLWLEMEVLFTMGTKKG